MNTQKKSFFLQTRFFNFCSFFTFFWTRCSLNLGATKGSLSKSSIMVSLAFSTTTVPILIRKWGQNMTTWGQEMHIPKYLHFRSYFFSPTIESFSIINCDNFRLLKYIFIQCIASTECRVENRAASRGQSNSCLHLTILSTTRGADDPSASCAVKLHFDEKHFFIYFFSRIVEWEERHKSSGVIMRFF